MSARFETEVCVVGGGPAGSAIARRLALLGHEVCLFEARPFPRPHVGESLPPTVLPLLEVLDVRQRVEAAGFLRPTDAVVRWPGAPARRSELGGQEPQAGFQVDRGRFDQILLAAASQAGVRLFQPARAGAAERRAGGWLVPVRTPQGTIDLRARYLVDAAGRGSAWRRRRRRTSPPTLALYAYWRGVGAQGPETRVEAGPRHWFWGAPLPDGSFNATVFVDPTHRPASGEPDVEELYRELLVRSTLLRGCLKGELVRRLQACDATCYAEREPIFSHGLKVGEAAYAIDPLSSQGVQTALRSGIQGAAVVHTLLRHPGNEDAAFEFHRSRQAEAATRHRVLAAALYAAQARVHPHPFWQRRAATPGAENPMHRPRPPVPPLDPEARLTLSPLTRVVDTPVLQGDVVTRRPALVHPALERAVAFSGGIPTADLVGLIPPGATPRQIARAWGSLLPAPAGHALLRWMWETGVVEVVGPGALPTPESQTES